MFQSGRMQDSTSLASFRGVGSSVGPQSDRMSAMKQAFSVSYWTVSAILFDKKNRVSQVLPLTYRTWCVIFIENEKINKKR